MKRAALFVLAIAVALVVLLGPSAAFAGRTAGPDAPLAGAPTVVGYQGQVTVDGVAHTGTGYFKFAIVDLPTCTTGYWMNDGSTLGCTAPTNAVSLAVSNGLFNVLLGDTSVTNMTALPASVFSGTTRYLRVWFSTESGGPFVHLTPDRRIAAVPYALQATNADYLDGQSSAEFATAAHNHDAAYVNVTGDSMSGTLNVNIPSGGSHGISSITTSSGSGASAVEAKNNGAGYGVYAYSATLYGIYAAGGALAGYFDGHVHVAGDLTVDGRSPFQRKYDNVVVVAKSGGDYTTIGAALAAITASASDRYLIWVAPGTYDETVNMEPYVDIQGAGEGVTKITYGGSSGWGTGTVVGANNAELRFLTVENTGGETYAIAILNSSASPRITHVTCVAAGGTTTTYGVRNISGSPVMTDVSISVTGSANAIGVYNNGVLAEPELVHVTVSASGAQNSYGIWSENSSTPTLQDVTVRVSGGSTNTAVRNQSPVTMLNVVAEATGSSGSSNYGVSNTDVVTLTHVTASATGGSNASGIYSTGAEVVMQLVSASAADASSVSNGIHSSNSTVTMTQVTATASGSGYSTAIYNDYDSTATMTQVTANATGSSQNYGVYNSSASASLNNSTVSATGGTANSGVYNYISDGAYTVTINNSQITGGTATISIYAGFTVRVGASQLAGGNISGTGTATCVGVYDENFASAGYTTCP
jgi:hypothetical protein